MGELDGGRWRRQLPRRPTEKLAPRAGPDSNASHPKGARSRAVAELFFLIGLVWWCGV